MSDLHLGKVRESNGFMRSIATVVLVTYFSLVVSPGVQAMQHADMQQAARDQAAAEEHTNLGKALGHAKEELRVLAGLPDALSRKPSGEERSAAKQALRTWKEEKRALIEEVRQEFESTGRLLEAEHLPEVVRQRHAEAMATFEREVTAFKQDLDAALATDDEAVEKATALRAIERLNQHALGRSQQQFDPNNLPNTTLKPDRSRVPKTAPEQFQAALLLSEPSAQFAQATGFDFSQLPGAENPSYMTGTTEVVLAPEIQAKADELNRNPVEIYNWVRNNVHWAPTWGAIQDASHTLSSQRGNAFDIASLTIALLRASGVPARYVHGTIEVPEDRFRNWAGGFEHIDAAIDFASSGGIPIVAVTSGGRITKIRLEHIWVEAALDFQPSRGVKNHSADSWVPIDPSFKQIEKSEGLNALEIAGVDAAALTEQLRVSGIVNESEGWASGFNVSILQNAQNQARQALESYIDQNLSGASLNEIVGGRHIVQHVVPILAATLPNRVVATGARYASVPSALQQRITFAFGRDLLGEAIDPQSFPWARLNNKQVVLSFRPATAADKQSLDALLPSGEIADPLQLPTSIPAYLIRVVPELKVDGMVVMSGSPMSLGSDLNFVFDPTFATAGTKAFSYRVPAGSYLAVAVVAGSINPEIVRQVRTRLTDTSAILQSSNPTSIGALNRERYLGDLFHAGVLGYYAQYLSNSQLAGLQQGGYHLLGAGLGSVGYEVNVDSFFGIPRAVRTGLIGLNIPIVNIVGRDSIAVGDRAEFTRLLGTMSSALESAVPQSLYSGTTYPADAVSAVKALSVAGSQGQRVYAGGNELNTSAFSAYPAEDRAELLNALRNGKHISVHTGRVSIPGWTGFGYIIEDPLTGEGAYKISGGANGGMMGFLDNVNDATRISRILFYLTGWVGEEGQRQLGAFGAFLGMLTGTASVLDDCLAVATSAQIGVLIAIQLMLSIALTFVPGGFLFRLIVNTIVSEIVKGFMEALKYLAGCRNAF